MLTLLGVPSYCEEFVHLVSKLVLLCCVLWRRVTRTCVVTLHSAAVQLNFYLRVLVCTCSMLVLLAGAVHITRDRVRLARGVLGSVVRSTGEEFLLLL